MRDYKHRGMRIGLMMTMSTSIISFALNILSQDTECFSEHKITLQLRLELRLGAGKAYVNTNQIGSDSERRLGGCIFSADLSLLTK